MSGRDPRRLRARAATEPLPVGDGRVRAMCRSNEADRRLLGLLLIARQIAEDGPRESYLDCATALVTDSDDSCRWQALELVGSFAGDRPQAVWEVLRHHGSSADPALRAAVATGLLEHLLEHHYDAYFPLLREEVERGNARLADTLLRCWLFGGAKRHSREVDRLLRSTASGE